MTSRLYQANFEIRVASVKRRIIPHYVTVDRAASSDQVRRLYRYGIVSPSPGGHLSCAFSHGAFTPRSVPKLTCPALESHYKNSWMAPWSLGSDTDAVRLPLPCFFSLAFVICLHLHIAGTLCRK